MAHRSSYVLQSSRASHPYTESEVKFAQVVASAAANGLANAALYEKAESDNVRLHRLANTDDLTGLHNHRHFQDQFGRETRNQPPLRLGPSFRRTSLFNPPVPGRNGALTPEALHAVALQERVDQLIRNYRVRGHIIAHVDPLGQPVPHPPELDPMPAPPGVEADRPGTTPDERLPDFHRVALPAVELEAVLAGVSRGSEEGVVPFLQPGERGLEFLARARALHREHRQVAAR